MSLRISFDDFQTGNFSVPAIVGIFYSDDGVDVGVGLLNDFWQVMDFNGRIMEINLENNDQRINLKGQTTKKGRDDARRNYFIRFPKAFSIV